MKTSGSSFVIPWFRLHVCLTLTTSMLYMANRIQMYETNFQANPIMKHCQTFEQ